MFRTLFGNRSPEEEPYTGRKLGGANEVEMANYGPSPSSSVNDIVRKKNKDYTKLCRFTMEKADEIRVTELEYKLWQKEQKKL
jgi:hypothetical protein